MILLKIKIIKIQKNEMGVSNESYIRALHKKLQNIIWRN